MTEKPINKEFTFTDENMEKVKRILQHYPPGKERSAVLPLLDLAQRQLGGWLSSAAIECVAQHIKVAPIRVYEVASFYTMFNLKEVGKYLIQVCRTTPCWLRGSDKLTALCQRKFEIDIGETTRDKLFTLKEVECLGGCVNGPIVQINDDYYEDLDEKTMENILDILARDEIPKIGSQIGRQCSAPIEEG